MTLPYPATRSSGCSVRQPGRVWRPGRGRGERVALKRLRTPTAAAAAAARAGSRAARRAGSSQPDRATGLRTVRTRSVVLVLELAEAGSLASLLRRRDRLAPAEVVAAHQPGGRRAGPRPRGRRAARRRQRGQHPVHRGRLRRSWPTSGWPGCCATARPTGTPAYLDPVLAAGGAAGPASDVFSLAAVALHALTGTGPWQRARPAGPLRSRCWPWRQPAG